MNKQQKYTLDTLRKTDVSNPDELIELVAKTAACTWCRCYKCDKIIRGTQTTCDKSKLITCHQWYDGYRTAMIALSDERIKKKL